MWRSHSTQDQSTASHCRLTRPTGEWQFMDGQLGPLWLAAKLHQDHATGSRDIQNGRILSGHPSYREMKFLVQYSDSLNQLSFCTLLPIVTLSALKIQLFWKVRQCQIANTEGMLSRRTEHWRRVASSFAMQQRLLPFSDEVSNDTNDTNALCICQNFEGSAAFIVRVKHSLTLNTISSKFVRKVGNSLQDEHAATSSEYQITFHQSCPQCLAAQQSFRIASCAEAYKQIFIGVYTTLKRARVGAVGWRTALQAVRSRVRFPKVLTQFLIGITLPDALWLGGSNQPLTMMSARDTSRGVKAAGVWSSQPYHLHVPTVL